MSLAERLLAIFCLVMICVVIGTAWLSRGLESDDDRYDPPLLAALLLLAVGVPVVLLMVAITG